MVTVYLYDLDLISQIRGGEQDFYHVDGLGSTRALTDEAGNVTDTYDYEAFGELIDSTGEVENSYLFAGEQFDEGLGQYYLRQRYYEQGIGRFTRRDTYEGRIGEPLTLHKYLYANADPVNGIDPSGFVTLAEISAARTIRNTFAGIQLDSYSYLIDGTLRSEDDIEDIIATNLAFAATFLLIGAVTRGLSKAASTIILRGGWLTKYEGVIGGYTLGHTLSRHVGKTDADLIARLANNKRLNGVTTFTNQAIAENVIADTLLANRNKIRQWLQNTSETDNLRLKYLGNGSTIGRGIQKRHTVVSSRSRAIVTLAKHPNPKRGYFILTAFPI